MFAHPVVDYCRKKAKAIGEAANLFYECAMAKAKKEKEEQSQRKTVQGMQSGGVRDDSEEVQVI